MQYLTGDEKDKPFWFDKQGKIAFQGSLSHFSSFISG